MKRKYEPQKRKPISEKVTKKNYSGEKSPYWDFVNNRTSKLNHTPSDSQVRVIEDALANPDILSDDFAMYRRSLTECGELQLEAIETVLPTLTEQQQKAIELCGKNGHTEEMAATILGIKRRTLRTILARVRVKIKREYDRLLRLEQ